MGQRQSLVRQEAEPRAQPDPYTSQWDYTEDFFSDAICLNTPQPVVPMNHKQILQISKEHVLFIFS